MRVKTLAIESMSCDLIHDEMKVGSLVLTLLNVYMLSLIVSFNKKKAIFWFNHFNVAFLFPIFTSKQVERLVRI